MLAESDAEATPLAQALDRSNRQRQDVEALILDQALKALPEAGALGPAVVLASEDWHAGVVGIVASRLVERTGRPSLVLATEGDESKGSGRSIPGFNLHRALVEHETLLLRFGGHAAAAGLTLKTEQIPALRAGLCAAVQAQLGAEQLGPRCRIDARVSADALDRSLAEDLARLQPFGSGNPEPVFALFGVRGEGRLLASRRKEGESHLKLKVGLGIGALDGIGFGMGGDLGVVGGGAFDAAFHLELDEWQGRSRLQLRLKALRAAA